MLESRFNMPNEQISKIVQDSLFLEERRSKGYINTMERIQVALDQVPTNKMKVDLRDIEARRGCLIYFTIVNFPIEVPFDVEYAPKLNRKLRGLLIERMENIRPRLSMTHRRLLKHMQFVHNWEHVGRMAGYDVEQRMTATLGEIERFKKMASVAHGVNKLEILRDALLLPARTHFELLSVLHSLQEDDHPGHREAMTWLVASRFSGEVHDFEVFIQKAFRELNQACESIFNMVENLTGLKFSRTGSLADADRQWYTLGPVVEQEDPHHEGMQLRDQLKRCQFEEIKRDWSGDYFEDRHKKILEISHAPKQRAELLARLILELQQKIEETPKPDGSVMIAIESDFNLNLLSDYEYQECRTWTLENWLRLIQIYHGVFQQLEDLREEHPQIALAQCLEDALVRVKQATTRDREVLRRELRGKMQQLDIEEIRDELEDLDLEDGDASTTDLNHLLEFHEDTEKKIAGIDVSDISFLRQLRITCSDWQTYEQELTRVYSLIDDLHKMRVRLERLITNCYRRMPRYSAIPERVLDRCLGIAVHHMFTSLKKLDYRPIEVDGFAATLDRILEMEPGEAFIRLDYLIQEVHAVPGVDYLIEALKTWNKDLNETMLRSRTEFLRDNEEKRIDFLRRLREEMKKRLDTTDRETRRARFEIFGFNDCNADLLAQALDILTTQLPKLGTLDSGERLVKDITAMEDRILDAQNRCKPGRTASTQVEHMQENGEINAHTARQLLLDLERNYTQLEDLMVDAGKAVKTARRHQVRFGRQGDINYLDLTLQLSDLEELKSRYGFLDAVTLEDLKRYCLTHRLVTDYMDDLVAKLRDKDKNVPAEVREHFTRKSYHNYVGNMMGKSTKHPKRALSRRLKTAILKHHQPILEAETQRIILFLNFADPGQVRDLDTFKNFVKLFRLVEQRDEKINRWLKAIWQGMRKQLLETQPEGYRANYEQNSRIFIDEIDAIGEEVKWL